jgi:serine/threonine protein kinase
VFGPREATIVAIDLCRALAAVHAAGLVHGDIKAQNVMREAGGRTVLMDFGAGRDLAMISDDGSMALIGTPLYMAPEIYAGKAPSVRSDIYSLGVLTDHMVSGSFPIVAHTLADVRERTNERRRLTRGVFLRRSSTSWSARQSSDQPPVTEARGDGGGVGRDARPGREQRRRCARPPW